MATVAPSEAQPGGEEKGFTMGSMAFRTPKESEAPPTNHEEQIADSATRLTATQFFLDTCRQGQIKEVYPFLLSRLSVERGNSSPYIEYQDRINKEHCCLILAHRGFYDLLKLVNEMVKKEVDFVNMIKTSKYRKDKYQRKLNNDGQKKPDAAPVHLEQYVPLPVPRTLVDKEKNSPLILACNSGNFSIVRYLLEDLQCAYVCHEGTGWYPLHYAAASGHFHIVEYLIDVYAPALNRKIDAAFLPADSTEPTLTPVYCKNADFWKEPLNGDPKKLRTCGFVPDIHHKTNRNETALMLAASGGYVPIVRFFLNKIKSYYRHVEARAQSDFENKEFQGRVLNVQQKKRELKTRKFEKMKMVYDLAGVTAYEIGMESEQFGASQLYSLEGEHVLTPPSYLDEQNDGGLSALFLAMRNGQLLCAYYLLTQGASEILVAPNVKVKEAEGRDDGKSVKKKKKGRAGKARDEDAEDKITYMYLIDQAESCNQNRRAGCTMDQCQNATIAARGVYNQRLKELWASEFSQEKLKSIVDLAQYQIEWCEGMGLEKSKRNEYLTIIQDNPNILPHLRRIAFFREKLLFELDPVGTPPDATFLSNVAKDTLRGPALAKKKLEDDENKKCLNRIARAGSLLTFYLAKNVSMKQVEAGRNVTLLAAKELEILNYKPNVSLQGVGLNRLLNMSNEVSQVVQFHQISFERSCSDMANWINMQHEYESIRHFRQASKSILAMQSNPTMFTVSSINKVYTLLAHCAFFDPLRAGAYWYSEMVLAYFEEEVAKRKDPTFKVATGPAAEAQTFKENHFKLEFERKKAPPEQIPFVLAINKGGWKLDWSLVFPCKMLIDANYPQPREVSVARALMGKRIIFVVIAEWFNDDCKRFTLKLAEALVIMQSNKRNSVGCVLVSLDDSEEAFASTHQRVGCLAVPFADTVNRTRLKHRFSVASLPKLMILCGETGEMLAEDGPSFLLRHMGNTYDELVKSNPILAAAAPALGDRTEEGESPAHQLGTGENEKDAAEGETAAASEEEKGTEAE